MQLSQSHWLVLRSLIGGRRYTQRQLRSKGFQARARRNNKWGEQAYHQANVTNCSHRVRPSRLDYHTKAFLIRMMIGTSITSKITGKMNRPRGKVSLTGKEFALVSARINRLSRISS